MKVLAIGNSHLAALRSAAKAVESGRDGVSLAYFGVPQSRIAWFEPDAGRIALRLPGENDPARTARRRATALKLNGAEEVGLDGVDAILMAGLVRSGDTVKTLIASADIDGYPDRKRPGLMTTEAFDAFCDSLIDQEIPAANWREATGGLPVYAYAKPHWGGAGVEDIGEGSFAYRHLLARPEGVEAIYQRYLDRLSPRLLEAGIIFLDQPEATRAPVLRTQPQFSRGSRRLTGANQAHPDDDRSHMNADFGKIAMEEFLSRLESDMEAPKRAG